MKVLLSTSCLRNGLFCLLFVISTATFTAAQGGAFTYQGRLNDNSLAANGLYNMQFSLWDSVSGGTQIGATIPATASVQSGIFTVVLDFGAASFANGAVRYLQIDVKHPADPGYVTLTPRQQIQDVPFATAARSITATRNPNAASSGSPLLILSGGATIGGTDLFGGNLTLGGGVGTGLGGGGNVVITTAGANDLSGTADNTSVERMIFVSRGKQLTLSAPGFTSLMSIHLVGTHTAGGRIYYMVRATDGGSQIATEEGVIQYLATANSITCTVQTTDKLHLGTVNSGCTPGFFNPGSQPGVSIFDNVSFSAPAPIVVHEVYFRIENESGSNIRLEP
jgi:hypothetical protein